MQRPERFRRDLTEISRFRHYRPRPSAPEPPGCRARSQVRRCSGLWPPRGYRRTGGPRARGRTGAVDGGRMSRLPSTVTPIVISIGRLATLPSLIFTFTQSRNSTGYTESRGRFCQSAMASITRSVLVEIGYFDTSAPLTSRSCAEISPVADFRPAARSRNSAHRSNCATFLHHLQLCCGGVPVHGATCGDDRGPENLIVRSPVGAASGCAEDRRRFHLARERTRKCLVLPVFRGSGYLQATIAAPRCARAKRFDTTERPPPGREPAKYLVLCADRGIARRIRLR